MLSCMVQKIIALDVDGTLVSWVNHYCISDETINLLNLLNANGHYIVFVTGRSMSHIYPLIDSLNFKPQWIVGANGATVFALQDDKYSLVFEKTLSTEIPLNYWLSYSPQAKFAIETAREGFRHSPGFTLRGVPLEIGYPVPVEELQKNSPAIRIVLTDAFSTESEVYRLMEEAPFDTVGYVHKINEGIWFEILPSDASKKDALEKVQNELGVPLSHVIAFGDGYNDVSMLEWVAQEGYSIAMGNSVPELKLVSSTVTSDVVDNGVYKILNRLVEEGKL